MKREGTAALDAVTDQALERFIIDGRWKADGEDRRVETSTIMFRAGPEVTRYADRADPGHRALRALRCVRRHVRAGSAGRFALSPLSQGHVGFTGMSVSGKTAKVLTPVAKTTVDVGFRDRAGFYDLVA